MSSEVQFDEDSFSYGRPKPGGQFGGSALTQIGQANYGTAEKGMVAWLMRYGIAKSSNFARGILVAVVIVNIVITFIMIKLFL